MESVESLSLLPFRKTTLPGRSTKEAEKAMKLNCKVWLLNKQTWSVDASDKQLNRLMILKINFPTAIRLTKKHFRFPLWENLHASAVDSRSFKLILPQTSTEGGEWTSDEQHKRQSDKTNFVGSNSQKASLAKHFSLLQLTISLDFHSFFFALIRNSP